MKMLCHISSVLTGFDYDIVKDGPENEKWYIMLRALLLVLVAGSSGIWWTIYVAQFMPWFLCPFVGLFGASIILIFDSAIGSADWHLKGMSANPAPRHKRSFWISIALRVGVSGIFGSVTSYALAERMQSVAIERSLEAVRGGLNRKVDEKAAQQVKDLRDQQLGDLQQEVAVRRKLVEVTVHQRGRRYGNSQSSLDAAERRLRDKEEKIQPKIDKIEAERVTNQVTNSKDPMLAAIAMEEIRNDPKIGPAARRFTLQWLVLLMTIELSYLLIKIAFEPSMICKFRQNKRSRLMEAQEMVDFENQMSALGGVARAMVERSSSTRSALLG